jgi:hypothetical protein
MRPALFLSSIAAAGLVLAVPASRAFAQVSPKVPTISTRQYTGGSARVSVSGSMQIDEDVTINTAASTSDGEMTWLQFGNSGSAAPNALITYGDQGLGIIVGRGKNIATVEGDLCKGKVDVTAATISGDYTCVGVVSYDAASGKMGKIDIKIRFSAKS